MVSGWPGKGHDHFGEYALILKVLQAAQRRTQFQQVRERRGLVSPALVDLQPCKRFRLYLADP